MAKKKNKMQEPVAADANREEREKALSATIAELSKRYGEGTIVRLGEAKKLEVEAISTGSLAVDIALGVGFPHRFPGMDESFDGVLFIGYHAMDNTVDAVICHTFSSATYQYMKVNGVEVGEMEIDGAMAGELGVPLIFV